MSGLGAGAATVLWVLAAQSVDLPADVPVDSLGRVLGFALFAGAAATAVALVYRWYSDEQVPEGVAVITGVAVVAAWLNTKSLLDEAILGGEQLFDPVTAAYTVAVFAASAIAADAGRRVGDDLARAVLTVPTARSIGNVGRFVRSAGRTMPVTLPETVDDLEGYDPIDADTRASLAGETFQFPRGLEPDALRARLEERLERDFGLESVVAEVDADDAVTALAAGSRRAGIGPSLTSGRVACAIRADPAPDATPGDAVSIWTAPSGEEEAGQTEEETTDERAATPKRVAAGELRGVIDDVATVAVAAEDGRGLEGEGYRLVTRPGAPDDGREFVSMLRRAPETVTTVRVNEAAGEDDEPAETALAGASVGSLPVAVLAIEREGEALAFPAAEDALAAGDVAYVLGRPEDLERLRAPVAPDSRANPAAVGGQER